MRLDLQSERLLKTAGQLQNRRIEYVQIRQRMGHLVARRTQQMTLVLTQKQKELFRLIQQRMAESRQQLIREAAMLDAYSPLKSLSRGYTLTYYEGHLLNSVDQVELEQSIEVKLYDGMLMAQVTKKEKNHE